MQPCHYYAYGARGDERQVASPAERVDAVAEWKRQQREVFVPLTYRPSILRAVDRARELIPLRALLRFLRLSPS